MNAPTDFPSYVLAFLRECRRLNVNAPGNAEGTIRDAFNAHYFVEDAVANYAAERAAEHYGRGSYTVRYTLPGGRYAVCSPSLSDCELVFEAAKARGFKASEASIEDSHGNILATYTAGLRSAPYLYADHGEDD